MCARPAPPITVAMLIQRYHPHLGGAENQLRALCPRLMARGIRPLILTRRLPGTAPREEMDGVPVFRFAAPGGKLSAAAAYASLALDFLWRNRDNVAVLHAHELLSPATIGLFARRLTRRPLVVKVLRGGALSDLRTLKRRPLGAWRWRRYLREVDQFIALSAEIEEELAREHVAPGRVVRIPNGVDVERFAPADSATRSHLRLELGLEDAPTAIFTGRLAPEKRVDNLLRVWPRVRATVPRAQLLVVGDGPSAQPLSTLASEGVYFLGRQESVLTFLQASDIFVLPSVAEGLSNAMLEAMACGLCCVLHPHGGAADAIVDGVTGRFLTDESDDALVRVLSETLVYADQSRRLGEHARQTVVRHYSLDATADSLTALYRELAAVHEGSLPIGVATVRPPNQPSSRHAGSSGQPSEIGR